jgi:DNA-binding Lrp family transcriptional regulator
VVDLISACVLIRAERGKFDEVAKNLKQIPEVRSAFSVLGRYDIVADIEARNGKALAHVILKANRLSGVIFTETLPEVEA